MRYLPQTNKARQSMLSRVGVKDVDELFCDVPKAAFVDGLVDLPNHQGELQVERDLSKLADKNVAASDVPFFLGAGVYFHHVPSTVLYHVLSCTMYCSSPAGSQSSCAAAHMW